MIPSTFTFVSFAKWDLKPCTVFSRLQVSVPSCLHSSLISSSCDLHCQLSTGKRTSKCAHTSGHGCKEEAWRLQGGAGEGARTAGGSPECWPACRPPPPPLHPSRWLHPGRLGQHHSSKALILRHSAFFTVQLSPQLCERPRLRRLAVSMPLPYTHAQMCGHT